ncbi:hypothetical protein [Sphingomonas sp. Mn802worker]|uniref:hypothetical protein n=1 Tax=Sphingomonas sp. Mn802worker TaxID=629773 RepID=UPI000380102D|nr:hypothetical protein [Sphingomonas sp. Mn802worker]
MNSPSTFHSLLAGVASVALVLPATAQSVSVSTPLALALATYRAAEADLAQHELIHYTPIKAHVSALIDALPHTQVTLRDGAIWSSDDRVRIVAAEKIVRGASRPRHERYQAYRDLLAGHKRRERAIARIRRETGLDAVLAESDRLGGIMATAQHAVLSAPAETITDLEAKLSLLVEVDEDDGEWLFPILLADVQRISSPKA